MTNTEDVAYHEAGHAVAAYILGINFDYVIARPDTATGRGGGVHIRPTRHIQIADYLTVLLAGEAAWQRFNAEASKTLFQESDPGAGSDWQEAEECAAQVSASKEEITERLTVAHQAAFELINSMRVWPAVEKVAKSLLRSPSLTLHRKQVLRIAGMHIKAWDRRVHRTINV